MISNNDPTIVGPCRTFNPCRDIGRIDTNHHPQWIIKQINRRQCNCLIKKALDKICITIGVDINDHPSTSFGVGSYINIFCGNNLCSNIRCSSNLIGDCSAGNTSIGPYSPAIALIHSSLPCRSQSNGDAKKSIGTSSSSNQTNKKISV